MSVIACDIYKLVFKKEHIIPVLKNIALSKNIELVEPVVVLNGLSEISESRILKLKEEVGKIEKIINYLNVEQAEKSINLTDKFVSNTVKDYANLSHEVDDFAEQLDFLNQKSSKIDSSSAINSVSKITDNTQTSKLPSELVTSELVYQKLLTVENDKVNEFLEELESLKPINVSIFSKEKNETELLLISVKDDAEFIDNFIEQRSNSIISVDSGESIPVNIALENHQNDGGIVSEISESPKLKTKLKLSQLEVLYDVLMLEITAYENTKFIGEYSGEDHDTKSKTFVELHSWVDKEGYLVLSKLVESIDQGSYLQKLSTAHRTDVRTKMSNNSLIKPFEIVTEFMGIPGSKELDPSPFLAFFFVVFFGFALGDAGYGFLILVGLLYYLFAKKPQGTIREGIKLMIYCSISTIFFGAITGGWFGVDVNVVGGTLGEALRDMKQIDLQSSIILVLVFSLIAGFIQQLFGVFLELVTYFKNGDKIGGLSGPGTWILLLLTMVIIAVSGMVPELAFVKQIQRPLIAIVMVLFAFGQGRKQKNLFLRPLIGLGSIFNITGYLSNTLSYARLLALGLATGVIASVINLIASILGGTDSVFGIIVTVLILIVGHLFNIALNVLGTFVNIIRLQLVEFFPRFYQAQGVAIEPRGYKPMYIKVPENSTKFGPIYINISNLFINSQK
jgi:V/A-type H+-transporting ATPase subunit I